MCLSFPMQVKTVENESFALCDLNGQIQRIDISFVPGLQPGDWINVHIGIAREKIEEKDAMTTFDALTALDMVRNGDHDVDHLFADLLNREPPRPPTGADNSKKS